MKIYEWIKANLKNDSIVIEAGSFDGADTQFFATILTEGKIYSFEPVPELFDFCSQRLRNYRNVKLSSKALYSETGSKKLFVSDRFGQIFASSSLLKPKEHLDVHPQITFNNERNIETINLDDFCKIENIESIDLMWLDMQGAEPLVLTSSPDTLKKTKYIYTEVSLIETYENVMPYKEFKEFFYENNFEIVFEDLPHTDMGNVLFKNLSFKS
jgi:FkbM family methyltransferase